MDRYDIAIIGTGPAGISAAITARVRNKNIILIGSRELSTKIEKASLINNYPGIPAVSGEQLKEAFLKHIGSMVLMVCLVLMVYQVLMVCLVSYQHLCKQ
jgi:thioredoxin reductase (NADPH)